LPGTTPARDRAYHPAGPSPFTLLYGLRPARRGMLPRRVKGTHYDAHCCLLPRSWRHYYCRRRWLRSRAPGLTGAFHTCTAYTPTASMTPFACSQAGRPAWVLDVSLYPPARTILPFYVHHRTHTAHTQWAYTQGPSSVHHRHTTHPPPAMYALPPPFLFGARAFLLPSAVHAHCTAPHLPSPHTPHYHTSTPHPTHTHLTCHCTLHLAA